MKLFMALSVLVAVTSALPQFGGGTVNQDGGFGGEGHPGHGRVPGFAGGHEIGGGQPGFGGGGFPRGPGGGGAFGGRQGGGTSSASASASASGGGFRD